MTEAGLLLTADYFSLFDLPQMQSLDGAALDANFLALQSRVHPDRHVNASDAERRLAMQWASRVNEAAKTLRDPLQRANYLLQLKSHDTQFESNTTMPVEFLMAQMELREQVADARESANEQILDDARRKLVSTMRDEFARLETLIDGEKNFVEAAQLVRQMMFQEKLLTEIDDALDAVVH
jgi:molecular chaperone HscB